MARYIDTSVIGIRFNQETERARCKASSVLLDWLLDCNAISARLLLAIRDDASRLEEYLMFNILLLLLCPPLLYALFSLQGGLASDQWTYSQWLLTCACTVQVKLQYLHALDFIRLATSRSVCFDIRGGSLLCTCRQVNTIRSSQRYLTCSSRLPIVRLIRINCYSLSCPVHREWKTVLNIKHTTYAYGIYYFHSAQSTVKWCNRRMRGNWTSPWRGDASMQLRMVSTNDRVDLEFDYVTQLEGWIIPRSAGCWRDWSEWNCFR